MVVRRSFDISSRHFLILKFLVFVVCLITNVNLQTTTDNNKSFYYLLHDAPIVESLNEAEDDLFHKIIVSRFDGFQSDIQKFFTLCARKSAVIGVREVLGLIRGTNDSRRTTIVPTGALVTDCVVACEVAAGFFPTVNVAVISSGCASAQPEQEMITNATIVRMKASWSSLVKPLCIFLHHFEWKTVAIISSYKVGLKTASDLVGGSLRLNEISVNFHDVDTESDLVLASDAVTEEKMKDVLEKAGEENNILIVFLTREDHVTFLKVAKKSDMLDGSRVIITINDIEESIANESAEETKTLQDGLIFMTPWINRTEFREKSWIDFGFFRDAAFTMFQGVKDATIDGKEKTTAVDHSTILKKMFEVDFTGATGHVSFDRNGERQMAFAFNNIRDGKVVEVLYYMSDDDYELKTEALIWPGGKTDTPKDTPKKEKSKAEEIIIFTVVALALANCFAFLFFCVIYRLLRYRTLLKTTKTWIIPWDDLRFHANLHGRNRSLLSVSRASHATTSHGSQSDSRTSLVDFSRTDETYFVATYKNSEVIAQRLNCASIDLTDRKILNEIYQSLSLSHENIVRYIGICPYQPNVAIIMSVAKRGSLQDLIMSSDRVVFTLDFMASLLLDIAKGMAYLHSTEIGSHGHLTSAKCVVDSKWTCQVSGCGLRRMKKTKKLARKLEEHEEIYFKGLLWTSPELLRLPEKNRPLYGSKEGDIFSFAIILQEVVLMKAPYPEESTQYYYKDIIGQIQKVSATPFRPALVEADCSDDWIDLIERSWNESVNKRPTFQKIIQDLENLSETQEQTPAGLMEKLMIRTEKHAMNLAGQVKQATAEVELERKRVYNLLHALLPRYVADRLEKGEGISAESFESCTMYYADIVGFTKLAASSSPMQVVELLNSLYSKYDEITDAHDTYKVETIGDCYVVASGLPIPNGKKHATEIANLALDVLDFIKKFDIPHMKGAHLQTRIGIHSGPVLAGIVGVKMPRYTVFGETTAVAERMEALGVANMIHITMMTADILKETKLYVIQKRGEMEVTRERILTTYFLLGLVESQFVSDATTTTTTGSSSSSSRRRSTPATATTSSRRSSSKVVATPSSSASSSGRRSSSKKTTTTTTTTTKTDHHHDHHHPRSSVDRRKSRTTNVETRTDARTSTNDKGLTDEGLKDETLKDKGPKDEAIKNEAIKDEGPKDEALKDEGQKDKGLKDQGLKDQGQKEQGLDDQRLKRKASHRPSKTLTDGKASTVGSEATEGENSSTERPAAKVEERQSKRASVANREERKKSRPSIEN